MIESLKNNRVQCWLCRRWLLEKHMKDIPFLNRVEKVCIICARTLKDSDEQYDLELESEERIAQTATSQHHSGRSNVSGLLPKGTKAKKGKSKPMDPKADATGTPG